MSLHLTSVLQPSTHSKESLILIEHNLSSPWFPLLHEILNCPRGIAIICVFLLHPPLAILSQASVQRAKILDWTERVPGYEAKGTKWNIDELSKNVLELLNGVKGSHILFIDSPDTLCADSGSTSKAYTVLREWHAAVLKQPAPSRLILPLSSWSSLLPLLITPSFGPSLIHMILHPPIVLRHLAIDYLTLPPPHSPASKFWPIFSGIVARGEAESLVWGRDGTGWGDEAVVEVLVRNSSGRRTVDRALEGWRKTGPCRLEELEELKAIWTKTVVQSNESEIADPTRNLPFNLSLTEAQQQSRAQVPLPYAHEGKPMSDPPSTGSIFYDPDSADDIDEDDPDEDLDI